MLSDNGGQFVSKFFGDVCRIVGTKLRFTTTYHPQANGQVERFYRTILAALRHHVGEHPKDLDLFTDALTFAYNTQVHTSTNCTPFELVLARPPVHLAMDAKPDLPDDVGHAEHRERWRSRLSALMSTATVTLRSTQHRYKRNFESRIRMPKSDPLAGDYVFIRKDHHARHEPKHKLSPIANGPYRVIDADDKTLNVAIGQRHERMSRDRVEWAPTPLPDEPPPVETAEPNDSEVVTPHQAEIPSPSSTSVEQFPGGGVTSPKREDMLQLPLQSASLQPHDAELAPSYEPEQPESGIGGGFSDSGNRQSHRSEISSVQHEQASPSQSHKRKQKRLRREKFAAKRLQKRASFATPVVEQFIPPVADAQPHQGEHETVRRSVRFRKHSTERPVGKPTTIRVRRQFPKPQRAEASTSNTYCEHEYVIDKFV